MSNRYYDYSKPTVGQASCTYSNLRNTYGGLTNNSVQIPTMSNYVVPQFCEPGAPGGNDAYSYPPSYSTLVSRGDNCGGYYSLKNAFPAADCNSCQGVPNAPGYNPAGNQYEPVGKFTTRQCASNIVPVCSNPVPQVPNPNDPTSMALWG